jgi:hypothetical protein
MLRVGVTVAVCFITTAFLGHPQNQTPPARLPTVVAAAMPSNPSLVRQATVDETARLRVYTDGEKVQVIVVLQATPLLATAAQENLKTWRFAAHVPTNFEVTFRFKRLKSEHPDPCGPKRNDPWIGPQAVSTFRFPTEVEIETSPDYVYICDPTVTHFGGPVSEIRGTVICACEGHRPVADAEVIVGESTQSPHRTRTDADGKFSVPPTKWGTNSVQVQKRGFFDQLYEVEFMPRPWYWYPPGDFELEIRPDAADGQPPPRKQAFLIPTTTPFYPSDARKTNVAGEVKLRVAPGGELTAVGGPAALLDPTFETARAWKVKKGDDAAELRVNYKLIDGDCLGGGPVVTLRGNHDIEVVAKRIVACGAGDRPAR